MEKHVPNIKGQENIFFKIQEYGFLENKLE